jgi:hypothetical protein
MEIRLEMAKVLGQFVSNENGYAGHYLKMLADFRKNVWISSILNINTSQIKILK